MNSGKAGHNYNCHIPNRKQFLRKSGNSPGASLTAGLWRTCFTGFSWRITFDPFWKGKTWPVTLALVNSRLAYCHAFPLKLPGKLQLMQMLALRMLVGTSKCSHITPVLWGFYWLPIMFSAKSKHCF